MPVFWGTCRNEKGHASSWVQPHQLISKPRSQAKEVPPLLPCTSFANEGEHVTPHLGHTAKLKESFPKISTLRGGGGGVSGCLKESSKLPCIDCLQKESVPCLGGYNYRFKGQEVIILPTHSDTRMAVQLRIQLNANGS